LAIALSPKAFQERQLISAFRLHNHETQHAWTKQLLRTVCQEQQAGNDQFLYFQRKGELHYSCFVGITGNLTKE
jgi:hypothetical protein